MQKAKKGLEAFILVETRAGKALEVASRLKKAPGVQAVYPVTGPYDIIVHVAVADLKSLASTAVDSIGSLPGVQRTLTCIVIGNPGEPLAG